ncbi:MAG: alpha/beta hydrolase [Leptolyngbya sp. SIO1D8]|nr:alpha/beta hydrolase [Leptolyngbya sp. SIO1D8]
MITQHAPTTTHSSPACMGGKVQLYPWQWQGRSVSVVFETLGKGEPVLLLPAMSTVSTRAELAQLAGVLAPHFQVTVLDWPGFGASARLRLAYQPELYKQCLFDFVQATFTTPPAVIAAGHAAGYVMQLAAQAPSMWAKIGLVAPTWRGPLAVMGAPSAMRSGVRALVRSPLIGQTLYNLNTHPAFLKWMYRRHVFVDAAKLTPDYIQQRHQGTQQPGARYAPAAFVTGGLDPVQTREAFLAYFEGLSIPVMVVVAEQAPPSSKAEMMEIAALPNLQVAQLPGTLGMAEEYGNEVAAVVLPFLQAEPN